MLKFRKRVTRIERLRYATILVLETNGRLRDDKLPQSS